MIHRQNFGIPPLEWKPPYLCKMLYIYIFSGCADLDMCIYFLYLDIDGVFGIL